MANLQVGILEDDEVLRRGIVAILSEQGCSCIPLDAAGDVSPGGADAKVTLDVAVICSKSARDLELSCPVILLTSPMRSGQASRHVTSKVVATLPHDDLTGAQLVASVRAAAAGLRTDTGSPADRGLEAPRDGSDHPGDRPGTSFVRANREDARSRHPAVPRHDLEGSGRRAGRSPRPHLSCPTGCRTCRSQRSAATTWERTIPRSRRTRAAPTKNGGDPERGSPPSRALRVC